MLGRNSSFLLWDCFYLPLPLYSVLLSTYILISFVIEPHIKIWRPWWLVPATINNICQNASLIIRNIGRKYLSQADIKRLVHAFITSRLDYCNSLLYGLPERDLGKLQHIQNTAVRLVTCAKCNHHSDPILRNLHWLPMNELLEPYHPPQLLRSAQWNLLKVPNTRTIIYGNRAFSYAAPTLWNSLPEPVKTAESLGAFKTALKTFLFSKAVLLTISFFEL